MVTVEQAKELMPWLEYLSYDEDFHEVWKENTPASIKKKYEQYKKSGVNY